MPNQTPRKIIIDTDPGQDDAIALLLALASPDELDVLGVIAVAGNVPLHHTLNNARRVVELSGRADVPVFAGSERPLRRTLVTAEQVHGVTGLDGVDLPPPSLPEQAQGGVDFLIETLRAAEDGEITLVTLGAMTDLGHAFTRAPDVVAKVREVVLMGGSWHEGGNITPAAEFNIYVDPDAADIVFKSGVPLVMLPLDATHGVRSTPERMARLRALPNRCGPMAAQILKASEAWDLAKFGWDGAPLHDPCTIAYLLQPELFSGRRVNVEIETQSELTLGMTVVDWWRATGRAPNALFLNQADADGFYALLSERLSRLP
ncbi:MAG: nucleoside hydrolase [Asticcacaulis sp.]|uniref:nucleoside hydrolase n=1 Tax=Asticcacaulis sp. TaxID=1872648 RepID=UPI003F7BE36C